MAQNQVYNVLDKLKEQGLQHPQCNTVTTGNLSDVDLSKTTIFPLTHLVVDRTTIGQRTITMTLNVICMDIVDISKDNATYNFYGNDNSQDVLNSQLNVLNNLFMQLKRGDLWNVRLTTGDDIDATPFMEKYENMLAGWEGQIQIQMPNEIAICDDGDEPGPGPGPGPGGLVPVVASSPPLYTQLGTSFSFQISATNNPTSYSIFNPPSGLTVDASTGLVSGIITGDARLESMSVTASNEYGSDSELIFIYAVTEDPTILVPPTVLTATDESFSVEYGFQFRLGWNYPPYVGNITTIQIFKDDVLNQTLTNVGASKITAVLFRYLSNTPTYSFRVKFGDSDGNFSALSNELLVDL